MVWLDSLQALQMTLSSLLVPRRDIDWTEVQPWKQLKYIYILQDHVDIFIYTVPDPVVGGWWAMVSQTIKSQNDFTMPLLSQYMVLPKSAPSHQCSILDQALHVFMYISISI